MFTRLFMRKHQWIRIDSLNPKNYENIESSVEEMERAGFLITCPSYNDLVDLLKKPELVEIAHKILNISDANRLKKSDLQLKLHKSDVGKNVAEKVGKAIKQSIEARTQFQKLFVIYQRLEEWPESDCNFMLESILTNLDEDDSRRISFPCTNHHRVGLIWGSIKEFEEYFNAIKLEAECKVIAQGNNVKCWIELIRMHKELEPKWKSILASSNEGHFTGILWFSTFTAGWVLTRMFSSIFYQAYFRCKRYDDAIHVLTLLLEQRLYLLTKRGFWFDELARLTENYVSKEQALLICKQGLSDTMVVTHHRSSLYKRLASLSKSLKRAPIQLRDKPLSPSKYPTTTIQAPHIRREPNLLLFKSKNDRSSIRVEYYVLEHFQLMGWKGYHSENSIITTLYGLLFWDILFDDSIPGAFAHPYQDRPLDLYSEFFFESRRASIFSRLNEIRNGSASLMIENVYNRERKKNTRCIGVNWEKFSLEELIEITDCIGPEPLGKFCELFSRQYWSHRGGMPDLCLWKPKEKKFKLVEVKSENDRLSERQIVWLEWLASANIDVEVVHVKDTKKRKRQC